MPDEKDLPPITLDGVCCRVLKGTVLMLARFLTTSHGYPVLEEVNPLSPARAKSIFSNPAAVPRRHTMGTSTPHRQVARTPTFARTSRFSGWVHGAVFSRGLDAQCPLTCTLPSPVLLGTPPVKSAIKHSVHKLRGRGDVSVRKKENKLAVQSRLSRSTGTSLPHDFLPVFGTALFSAV